ncbi:MAG: RDD family protein [Pseudonocardiales bacterium]|nr:RDD family protein [Pseudonocardiales bacterium]
MPEAARLGEPATSPQADTGAQIGRAPHTVHLEPPLRPSDVGELGAVEGPQPLAGFGARAISFLIDYVVPVIVLNLLISLGVVTGSPSLAVVGCLGLLGFGVWNSGYLQGTTGRSLGRRVANTKLVTIETGRPVGFGGAVARQICHALEFGIGYLWPLWDGKRQTFADKIARTVVIRIGPEPRADAATEDRTDSATP